MEIVKKSKIDMDWYDLVSSSEHKNGQNNVNYQFENFLKEFSNTEKEYSKKIGILSDRYLSIIENQKVEKNTNENINLFRELLRRLKQVSCEHNNIAVNLNRKFDEVHISLENFKKERKNAIRVHDLNTKKYDKSQKELKNYENNMKEGNYSLNCFVCSSDLKMADYKYQIEKAEWEKSTYFNTKFPEDLIRIKLIEERRISSFKRDLDYFISTYAGSSQQITTCLMEIFPVTLDDQNDSSVISDQSSQIDTPDYQIDTPIVIVGWRHLDNYNKAYYT